MKALLSVACSGWMLFGAGWATAGCARVETTPPPSAGSADPLRPAPGEFSVMTFNLHQYALIDRDGSADTLEPKPREETAAIIECLRQVSPDILAVQEIGDPAAWNDFKLRLREAGLGDYLHEEYLRRDPGDRNLAVLSRFPIVARTPRTDDTYTIGPTQFPVRRGFLEVDIEVSPAYRLRLMVAHLKSKLFHAYGQAEMRRNEARLLSNHVRASLKENPAINLLVVGDLNDDPSSRPLREILFYQDKPILRDLRPEDGAGAAWTYRGADDNHQRLDYLLASDGLLPETVMDKTRVVNFPSLARASDHRPLVGTFVAAERGAESAPPLTSRPDREFPMDE